MGAAREAPRVPEGVGSRMLLAEELLLRASWVPGAVAIHLIPTISQCGLQLGKLRHHAILQVLGGMQSQRGGSRVQVLKVMHYCPGQKPDWN